MENTETYMCGRYTRELANFAIQEAERVRKFSVASNALAQTGAGMETHRLSVQSLDQQSKRRPLRDIGECLWKAFVGITSNDWVFMTMLGISMALVSFVMDFVIEECHKARLWVFEILSHAVAAQYFSWILMSYVLVFFSVGFCHLIGPNAVGSGIPEMKTIIRGVVLKEYLTFRTLVAKVIGLSAALGSGLPIGKEGPCVHLGCIIATVLSHWFPKKSSDFQNESRKTEVLAAACAVGVAATFASPIGGVLFSIEVTATYFAVRNYWRGFYSSVCGAITFRLLAIWFHDEATLTALFKSTFIQEVPFTLPELFSFAVVGIICGFGGVAFVLIHKNVVLLIRRQKNVVAILQKNRFIYPTIITTVVMSGLFPSGLGQFLAGPVTYPVALDNLFDNLTWSTREPESIEEEIKLKQWRGASNSVFVTLSLFVLSRLCFTAISTTMPIPCGTLIPSLGMGAGVGRLCGEVMAVLFPNGIGGNPIIPGGYAMIGAAAFAGSATQTVSTAVIVFELTGQLGHILPCLMTVFISNVISRYLTASYYDMVIEVKNLPFLPSAIQANKDTYNVKAQDFMQRDIKYITKSMSYRDVFDLLLLHHYRYFPVIECKDDMKLLGTVHRVELERLVGSQLSEDNKLKYFEKKLEELNRLQRDSGLRHGRISRTSASGREKAENQIIRTDNHRRFTVQQAVLTPDELIDAESASQAVNMNNIKKNVAFDGTDQEASRMRVGLFVDSLDPVQEQEWQDYQMDQKICLDSCQVEFGPFQVVAKTSLYKVHALFSFLNLHEVYVTDQGKLVGIISLQELRKAVQGLVNRNGLRQKLKTFTCVPCRRA